MSNQNISEIGILISKAMLDGKFDGLYNDECACHKDDLWPCDGIQPSCELGVYVDCEGDEYDFCIGPRLYNVTDTNRSVLISNIRTEDKAFQLAKEKAAKTDQIVVIYNNQGKKINWITPEGSIGN